MPRLDTRATMPAGDGGAPVTGTETRRLVGPGDRLQWTETEWT